MPEAEIPSPVPTPPPPEDDEDSSEVDDFEIPAMAVYVDDKADNI